jgi:hypothetical protein
LLQAKRRSVTELGGAMEISDSPAQTMERESIASVNKVSSSKLNKVGLKLREKK